MKKTKVFQPRIPRLLAKVIKGVQVTLPGKGAELWQLLPQDAGQEPAAWVGVHMARGRARGWHWLGQGKTTNAKIRPEAE